eukprot:5251640-Amphidinium_carterae.1
MSHLATTSLAILRIYLEPGQALCLLYSHRDAYPAHPFVMARADRCLLLPTADQHRPNRSRMTSSRVFRAVISVSARRGSSHTRDTCRAHETSASTR